jgi:serine/threonine protein kinase
VAADGRVLVSDFGIAKFEGADATSEGVVKGKVSYMSPEQASAAPVDRRSDLFALGSVFYEMLTLERPFSAENAARTLLRVVSHDPPPPEDLVPGIPKAVSRVLMSCLRKDVDARYATAREFEEAVREAMREHPSRADEEDVAQLIREDFPDLGQPLLDRLGRLTPEVHAGTGTTLGMSAENSAPERSSSLRRVGVGAVLVGLVAAGLVFAGRRTVDTGSATPAPPASSSPQPVLVAPPVSAAPDLTVSAPAPKMPPTTPAPSPTAPKPAQPTARPAGVLPRQDAAPVPTSGPKPFESL